jgi:hypothetical protein
MTLAVSGVAPYATDTTKLTSKFIPEVWSGKMQVKYYLATCLTEITNNDWEGEIKDTGDIVNIRVIPNVTISNYTKGLVLTSEVPSSTPLTLNIDKGKYFQVVIDDVDKVQADVNLLEQFTQDAGEQMKIVVENGLLADVPASAAAANKGNSAGAISANIRLGLTGATNPAYISKNGAGTGVGTTTNSKPVLDHLVDMKTVLDEQNVPQTGRWLLIPPAVENRLHKGDLKDASITGESKSPILNGKLPNMIAGFTVYVSNNLPKTGAELTILAGTRDAITFASQLTKLETLRSTATFGDIVRGLNVYGYKVVKDTALVTSIVTIE